MNEVIADSFHTLIAQPTTLCVMSRCSTGQCGPTHHVAYELHRSQVPSPSTHSPRLA